MSGWFVADLIASTALTVTIIVFAVRYGVNAPWWKSFEGIVIEGTMIAFSLIMVNLLLRFYLNWPYYPQGMAITMGIGAVFMVYQNVLLTRARRKAREKAQR